MSLDGLPQPSGVFDGHYVPAVRLTVTGTLTLANWTSGNIPLLSWDTVVHDLYAPSAQFAAASPTRLTCRASGIYLVYGSLNFPAASAGQRYVRIFRNGVYTANGVVESIVPHPNVGTFNIYLPVAGVVVMVAGDYLEFGYFQNSGGAMSNVALKDEAAPFFGWALLSYTP